MGMGGLFMIVFWGLIIWAIVGAAQGSSRSGGPGDGGHDNAMEVLKRRYARGEVSREEYEEKKRDMA